MKRSRINPVSKRRRQRDRYYQRARGDLFERAGGRCEANASWACTRRCEQVHHRAGRGGDDPHRLDNLLGVCDPCHRYIHREPELAYAHGWSVRRNSVQDAEGEAYEPGDVA